jgi:hypothetical protein
MAVQVVGGCHSAPHRLSVTPVAVQDHRPVYPWHRHAPRCGGGTGIGICLIGASLDGSHVTGNFGTGFAFGGIIHLPTVRSAGRHP